jgi:phenylacetate-CoA ligase
MTDSTANEPTDNGGPGETYFDDLERRSPEAREGALLAALPKQVANARSNTERYSVLLRDVESGQVTSRKVLATLPITRKTDLAGLQRENPPFGGLASVRAGDLGRVFGSPGPIFEPEARRADNRRMARALFAAGFRRGELIHNSFSYHFTPAGAMVETGAHALGCAVFPAGTGQSDQQLGAIVHLRPQGFAGTPSYLMTLLERAAEHDIRIDSLCKALVSGEALPRKLRRSIAEHGVSVRQCYATADIGLIAYESGEYDGLILDEGVILEIVRPGTGDPLPDGEVGEVVITTLAPEYPLLRFATGDLSAVVEGMSRCGRTNVRIKGWMGRADQSVKIKGMFVHPEQVAELQRVYPEVKRARLIVQRSGHADTMTLKCEVGPGTHGGLPERVALTLRDLTKLRGEVELTQPDSLPNDGLVIEDLRPID